jgi:hypothetical protein
VLDYRRYEVQRFLQLRGQLPLRQTKKEVKKEKEKGDKLAQISAP